MRRRPPALALLLAPAVTLAASGCPGVEIEPDAAYHADAGPRADGALLPDGPLPPDAAPCNVPPTCAVTFTYPRGAESSVTLRGDFAEDGWTVGVPLVDSGSEWTASLTLAHRQAVHYKYLVDDTDWVRDPGNPSLVPDGFGDYNSVKLAVCGTCAWDSFDWRDAVLYFVLVDRFLDGDPANDAPVAGVETPANYQGGDLEGVRQKIEEGYFESLGVNTLWLSSPAANADGAGAGVDGHDYSAYHGYWPTDLTATDSHVGTMAELQAVVDAAHAHGLRVMLDYVMNHVHQDSEIYATHPEWFWPLNNCVCGEGCSWDTEPDRLRCWFRPYLPDFNFQVTAARDFSVGNAVWWAQQTGVDGYRLDAVKHIEKSWLTDLRGRLGIEVEVPGQVFYLVGETYSGDRDLLKSYVDPATMLDGQFDFPLRAALARAVLMRVDDMSSLGAFAEGNLGYYGAGAVMGTFLGNHDLPRAIHLAESPARFGEWEDGKSRAWTNQPSLPAVSDPFERMAVAFAFLLTTPGVPLVYYGDEIGMAGAGDPDNRRMMAWTGLTDDQTWLRERVAGLARARAVHPATRRGAFHVLGASADVLVYEMTGDGDHVWVALNRGDAAAPATGLPPGTYRDVLDSVAVSAPLEVPARTALVLAAP